MPLDSAQWQIDILAADKTSQAFASAQRNIQAFRNAQSSIGKDASTVAGQVTELAESIKGMFELLLASEVVAFFRELNNKVIETANAIVNQADAVGVTAAQLQVYQAAARDAGVSTDALQTMLGHFNSQLGLAQQGNKEVIDTLTRLKVNILDGNGAMRDQVAILQEASNALINETDVTKRAADSKVLFGRAGATAIPIIRQFAQSLNDLASAARQSGQVMDDQTLDRLKHMQDETEAARKKLAVLWAQFAQPIDLRWLNTAISALERIQNFRDTQTLKQLSVPIEDLAELRKQAAEAQKQISGGKSNSSFWAAFGFESVDPVKNLAAVNAKIAQTIPLAEAAQAQIDEINRRKTSDMIGPPPELPTVGTSNPPPAKTGNERDRIGEEMARLKGEIEATSASWKILIALSSSQVPYDELSKQVEMAKKVGDELAKIGKYDPKDPRLPQIVALVKQLGAGDLQVKTWSDALKEADTVERQFGDGSLQLAEQMRQLFAAFQTGRLSPEAYSLALQQTARNAEDLRLKNIGLAGGLPALAAGWRYAADQYAQQNTLFAIGGQVFTQSVNLIDQAINELVTNGTINFAKLAQSFAAMLLQMELRAAASFLFNELQAAFTTIPTPAQQGVPSVSVPAFNAISGARADGGDVSAGGTYLVGENGPELLHMGGSGHVYNGSQIAGGGPTVTVPVTIVNTAQANVSQKQSTGPGGAPRIDIFVEPLEAAMANRLDRGQGALAKVLAGRMGVTPVGRG